MATTSCYIEQVPFCCGMFEAGHFNDVDDYKGYDHTLECDSVDELLSEILEDAEGRPVLFNFVKCRNYEGVYNAHYEASDLRRLVQAHRNVVAVGKWTNPGSKNQIDAYIIKDYKSE
jgi:hypothetical protein